VIATYTVVDKHGVVHASPVAYLEVMCIFTAAVYAPAIAAMRGTSALRAELQRRSVAAGVGTLAAYAFVLGALQLASAASVAACGRAASSWRPRSPRSCSGSGSRPGGRVGAMLVVAGIVLLGL